MVIFRLSATSKSFVATPAVADKMRRMSVTELKREVDALSPRELAELSAYIAKRDNAEWDAQIDRDFSKEGLLRPVLEEVQADMRAGRLDKTP